MRKKLCLLAIVSLALVMALGIVGCGSQNSSQGKSQDQAKLENDTLTVDGIYVDESYKGSKAQDGMKRVYVFATVHPKKETLKVSSASSKLKASKGDASDTYNSADVIQNDTDGGSEAARWASSFYCSNVIKEVQPEKTFKIILPFNVSDTYLADGAKFELIQFNGSSEYAKGIEFPFSSIKSAANLQEMAQQADPEGYKQALEARNDAPPEVAQDVMNKINNYEYYATSQAGTITCSFEGNSFTYGLAGNKVSGTYTVKNGYLACTQSGTGWVNWIPWKFDETKKTGIDVDLGATFVEK